MKKVIILSLVFVTMSVHANDEDLSIRSQILSSEIERLTQERDSKYEKLKQCEKTTEGFKIAGITTLVATGFGIYGNIKLAQKIKGKTTVVGAGAKSDTRSTEQKAAYECAMFCADIPEDAEKYGCSC